jgi:DNA-binding beta-propeller fold protein YncE
MSLTNTCGEPVATAYSRKTFLRAGLILGFAFALALPQHARAAEPAAAPHIGEGGIPQFERVPNWAKSPAAWTHGAIGTGVTFDDQNNVWLITRPNALLAGGVINRSMIPGADWHKINPQPMPTPLKLPASAVPPPVIQFDENGKVLQSWGGKSGPGYVFPSNPHSIAPGPNGSLLVIGYKDINNFSLETQLLKFTKDGKFLSAAGKSDVAPGSNYVESFNGPTGAFYYAKTNEIFVADGYINSRVVVLDADTGKFKRTWGAYGHKPIDPADRKPPVGSKLLPPAMGPWVPVIERIQQFKDLHDIKVSNDGLVYAADRGNRRVQVFTIEGKYLAEQFVNVESPNDFQVLAVDFSPDQRFLYVGGAPGISILNRKTLEILGSFDTTASGRIGHHMGVDRKGNIYVTYGYHTDYDGKPYGLGILKYAFKGYSPTTK